MSYLKAVDGIVIKYPYTRGDLTADNPNVSFPADPTAEDLAPFDAFIPQPTPRPVADDQRTQRVERIDPVLIDGSWREAWVIRDATDAEIMAYDRANAPAPNWAGFKAEVIASEAINAAFLAALPQAPIATLMLPAALNLVAQGAVDDFIAAWSELLAKNAVPEQVLDAAVAMAISSNLPSDFIDRLQAA
jgi:hypothetical protein